MANGDGSGFTVWVYALSSIGWSFGGQSLPANPNTVTIYTSQTADNVRTRVEQSEDHGYKTIRVLGERIVVCASLFGGNVHWWQYPENGVQVDQSLDGQWSNDLEKQYQAGTGNPDDPAEVHDQARQADKFRAVYQSFVVKDDWYFQNGDAAPKFDQKGALTDGISDQQTKVLATLEWTPLEEGVDYSVPSDHDDGGDADQDHDDDQAEEEDDDSERPLLPPQLWIGYQEPANPQGDPCFKTAADAGINFSIRPGGLGFQISTSPNHLMAKNHWGEGEFGLGTDAAPTNHRPEYDWQQMILTLAWRSDQRIMLETALPGASPSGGVLEIRVPEAECWVLTPGTMTGLKPGWGGNDQVRYRTMVPVFSPQDGPWVLRNDSDKLWMAMAGALSRYATSRTRAEVQVHGLLPWGTLVGQILTVIDDGGESQQMAAPITQVEWQVPEKGMPTTIVRAGFAHAHSTHFLGRRRS